MWGGDLEDQQNTCPVCGSKYTVGEKNTGIVICKTCGKIFDEKIWDSGPEWRTYEQMDLERERTGDPTTFTIHDKGLSTEMGFEDMDALGKRITSKAKSQIYRLRKWQSRSRVSGRNERSLAFALAEIGRMCSLLGVSSDVRESASKIYRKAMAKGMIRGRRIEAIASASIYAACRQFDVPISLEDLTEVSNVDKKTISRCYRLMSRELNIRPPLINPTRYISRLGSDLDLSGEMKALAIDIIDNAKEKGLLTGKKAKVIAATAIYIACKLSGRKISQREISEVSGVSTLTLRKHYKELTKNLDLDI